MPLFNTREEYEHWVTTGEPPATFVDPAVVVADAPKPKQRMKKISVIAAWMGGAPATKPVKKRDGEIEQLQQPVNISRPQAQEPGGPRTVQQPQPRQHDPSASRSQPTSWAQPPRVPIYGITLEASYNAQHGIPMPSAGHAYRPGMPHAYSARQAVPTISNHDLLAPSTERAQPSQPVLSARRRSDMLGSFPREAHNFRPASKLNSSSESSDSKEEERRRDEERSRTRQDLEAREAMPLQMVPREPGKRRPTLTRTRTASAESRRTQSRASSETSGRSEPQPRPEYVDMDRTVNEAEAYQATERGNTRPATVTAEAVKRPSTGSHVSGSSRKSTSPSVRTGGRVRVMPEGASFYISHKTALQGRQKTQSPDHVTSKVEPDELGCHDEGSLDLGEDEVLPEQRMRSRSRRCSDISSREIEYGGDEDDPDEDIQSDSDDEQRFRARSLRRSHNSGLGFDFDVDPGASSPSSEAVDAADEHTKEFGGHKGVSSDCGPPPSRPPTNISGGYNIDFDPPDPTASGNEDMLDPPPPVRTGSPPTLDIPSPPIQDQGSRLRLRAKSDHQPPTSEPRGYNAQPGDSWPLTSATYLPNIPPLSDHNLDLQPGRSAVLAMLREGKIPCLEGFPSTDIESSAHVSTMYEWLCDEEYESSSSSLAENQRRSPSPPPTGRENRAVLALKTTTSDVGSDDDVSEDVSAVQALLNRWLDSSASALLLKDDAPVT
jgi:hypothetical protein